MQIGAVALLPVVTTAVVFGNVLLKTRESGAAALLGPGGLWITLLAVASAMLLVVALFSLFGAFIARGGVTLRAFGATIVNRHGEPASRFRALWRATITWSLVPVMLAVLKGSKSSEGADLGSLIVCSLPMALFVAGAVWAILHPSRSIQDRLAGTWIVPG